MDELLLLFLYNSHQSYEVLFSTPLEWCQSCGMKTEAIDVNAPDFAMQIAQLADRYSKTMIFRSGMLFKDQTTLTKLLIETGGHSLPTSIWLEGEAVPCGIVADREAILDLLNENPQTESELFKEQQEDYFICSTIKSCDAFFVESCEKAYEVGETLRKLICKEHMKNGVRFVSLDGVIINREVKIAAGTLILPNTIITGKTAIGHNSEIGPSSVVSNSTIGDNVKINASQCYDSTIEDGVSIGPFCHIRPNSLIKSEVHIGDFVEIKNSVLDSGTHVSHLTYVGDSDVGKNVNFGCGTVTVNFNGKAKARCQIGDNAFIGCNSNLVAPVTVGESAYIAAGSTVTEDVPPDAFAIARSRQITKEDYNKKLR